MDSLRLYVSSAAEYGRCGTDVEKRRASSYGIKVGLVEATYRLGGTCVNVG